MLDDAVANLDGLIGGVGATVKIGDLPSVISGATCRRIAENHGWCIWCAFEPGRECRFVFALSRKEAGLETENDTV
ncbi:MAG: hypothetical protein AAGA21_14035 [Pseudomonadota bacterium]